MVLARWPQGQLVPKTNAIPAIAPGIREERNYGRRVFEQAPVRGRQRGAGDGGHVRRFDGLHGRRLRRGCGRGHGFGLHRRRRSLFHRSHHHGVAARQLLGRPHLLARGHRRGHHGGMRPRGESADHHRLQRGHRVHRVGQGADGAVGPRGLRAGQQEEPEGAGRLHEQRRGRRPRRRLLLQPHLRAQRRRRPVQKRR